MTIHDEAEKCAAVIAATANHISNSDAPFPVPVDGIYSAADIIRTLSARLREAEARPALDLTPVREALIHARNQIQHPDQLIDEAIALIGGEKGNG